MSWRKKRVDEFHKIKDRKAKVTKCACDLETMKRYDWLWYCHEKHFWGIMDFAWFCTGTPLTPLIISPTWIANFHFGFIFLASIAYPSAIHAIYYIVVVVSLVMKLSGMTLPEINRFWYPWVYTYTILYMCLTYIYQLPIIGSVNRHLIRDILWLNYWKDLHFYQVTGYMICLFCIFLLVNFCSPGKKFTWLPSGLGLNLTASIIHLFGSWWCGNQYFAMTPNEYAITNLSEKKKKTQQMLQTNSPIHTF